MHNKELLIEKLAYIIGLTINEARIQRTINGKIWATVASGICKKYKNDFGATCKARSTDTKEVLLQKYVAALLILKQPCPATQAAFENGKVFPLWAKALVSQGISLADVTKLYNLNSGQGQAVAQVVDKVADIPEEPVAAPAPSVKKPKVSVPADMPDPNDNEGYKVTVNLRMLIPSTNGGGYEDTLVEEYVDNNDYPNRIIDVIELLKNKYNTPEKKRKCRDGWYSTYYHIDIVDLSGDNIKANIEITRERNVPRIACTDMTGKYHINEPLNIKMIYGNNTPVKAQPVEEPKSQQRWKITYIPNGDDDIAAVWYYADTKAEAVAEFNAEHNGQIIMISKLKH